MTSAEDRKVFDSSLDKGSKKNCWLIITKIELILVHFLYSMIAGMVSGVGKQQMHTCCSVSDHIPTASSSPISPPKYSLLLISDGLKFSALIVSAIIGYNVPYFCLIPPGQSSNSVPPTIMQGTVKLDRMWKPPQKSYYEKLCKCTTLYCIKICSRSTNSTLVNNLN